MLEVVPSLEGWTLQESMEKLLLPEVMWLLLVTAQPLLKAEHPVVPAARSALENMVKPLLPQVV